MKRLLLSTLLVVISLSSCKNANVLLRSREVEDLELIHSVGIDKSDFGLSVTAATAPGEGDNKPKFYYIEAKTLAEAVDKLTKLPVGKEAIFSHAEHIVISEQAAREGVAEVLDFVERSNDFRLATNLFIVRDMSAREFLESVSGEGRDVSELLSYLKDNAGNVGQGWVFTVNDIASTLSRRGCALAAAVRAEEEYPGAERRTVKQAGFAVLRDAALAGFVDEDAAGGVMLIMNLMRSQDIVVEAQGAEVSLIVNGTKTSLSPVYSESGELREVRADVEVRANVASVSAPLDLRSAEVRRAVELALCEAEYESIAEAFNLSRSIGEDFMDICSVLAIKHPQKYLKTGEIYAQFTPETPVKLRVFCRLSRTFDLEVPVNTEGKETYTIWGKMIK